MLKYMLLIIVAVFTVYGEENFYPNGSFEKWNTEYNTPTHEHWRWNRKSLAAKRSSKEAFSGKYSLYLKDTDSGRTNSFFQFSPGEKQRKKLAGKKAFFSARIKAVSMNPLAKIGLGIWGKSEGKTFSVTRVIDRSDLGKWKRLSFGFQIPENTSQLTFWLMCSNGYGNTGEAYFDDVTVRLGKDSAPERTKGKTDAKIPPPPKDTPFLTLWPCPSAWTVRQWGALSGKRSKQEKQLTFRLNDSKDDRGGIFLRTALLDRGFNLSKVSPEKLALTFSLNRPLPVRISLTNGGRERSVNLESSRNFHIPLTRFSFDEPLTALRKVSLEFPRGLAGNDLTVSTITIESEIPGLAERETNREVETYRKSLEKKSVFRDDGMTRPVIRNGTWEFGGKPTFLLGGFLHGAPTAYNRDWPEQNPNPQNIDHFAYREAPSAETFAKIGFNSSQIMADSVTGQILYDAGTPADWRTRSAQWKKYHRRLGSVPLTGEFSFGFNKELAADNRPLAEELKQRYPGWHSFIPFCPEDPRGKRYYECFMRGGVLTALNNNANIFAWELFNESVYGCQCVFNKKAFAAKMKEKYRSLKQANAIWNTVFGSFEELESATSLEQYPKLWPDWCEFVSSRYIEILKEHMAFIRNIDHRENVFFTEQDINFNLYSGRGATMDYRKIADLLDFVSTEGGWRYGTTRKEKTGDNGEAIVLESSSRYAFIADLMVSLARGRKPVNNHEHYCARYEDGIRVPSRRSDIVSSLWAEIMHGISAAYLYSWDKRSHQWRDPASAKKNALGENYKAYSYLNPYNWPPEELSGIKMFEKELEPYREKILPFPRFKKPSVAILYCYESLRMDKSKRFETNMTAWHRRLLFSHYPFTFVFEKDLEKGLDPFISTLLVPYAPYASETTRSGIERFLRSGRTVLAGAGALKFDERGNPVNRLPSGMRQISGADQLVPALRNAGVRRYIELDPSFRECEVQLIDRGEFKMVFLLNLGDAFQTKPGVLKLHLDTPGEFFLCDPINKRLYRNGTKDTWTTAELSTRGVRLPIPPQERLILTLEREKAAGLTPISDLSPLMKMIAESEAPAIAKAAERMRKNRKRDLAARRYDGVDIKNCRPLDLSKAATRSFQDEFDGDRKGGWFDQGNNDFAQMPLGDRLLAGIPFRILDPSKNNDKSAVILYGRHRPYFPKSAKGIPVNAHVRNLYFLHCSAWTGADNTLAMSYIVHYADGSLHEIPVRTGMEIGDWHGVRIPANGKFALEMSNPHASINLQCYRWTNHRSDRKIVSLDIISAGNSPVPAVVAITAEIPPEK